MSDMLRAIGLMSGTSMDGIDIALIETDGESRVRRIAARSTPYDAEFRKTLTGALRDASTLNDRNARPGSLARAEAELTARHAKVVWRLLGELSLQPSGVDLIGFHGQTVLHRPEQHLTVQIGDGAGLARACEIDVVHDLRAADMAAGGQGAPLAPAYHRALAAQLKQSPVAFLNLGGVGNVTWIGADGRLLAFDTGPGNAMIDDWMAACTGLPCDQGGVLAASGEVDQHVLAELLDHPYFASAAPKSLDRNAFSSFAASRLAPADGAATLTAFTVAAVSRAQEHFPGAPRLWLVCGGGRHNDTMMKMLSAALDGHVMAAEACGIDGDSVEAEAWAYLAVRSLKNLPITFPGTTGVAGELTGGRLSRAG